MTGYNRSMEGMERYADLRPCFDTTVDIVAFKLSDPMNYEISEQPVTIDGQLLYWGTGKESSSSSDGEYTPKS
jgi:hypothetical protein